jgi:hypothetical protein
MKANSMIEAESISKTYARGESGSVESKEFPSASRQENSWSYAAHPVQGSQLC